MPSKSEPPNHILPHSSLNLSTEMEIKEEKADLKDDELEHSEEEYNSDGDRNEQPERPYPMDLPLEVITTIEPFNFAYPVLKNMSNGVLTHRNIFTEVEREVLRKIVEKYRDIVDTRSRTREIYLEKQNVWQHIVEEYNGTDNIMVRTEKELRKCWDNMKYRARQAVKEQQQKAEMLTDNKSPNHPHQLACNAVQAALEKMLSAQTSSNDAKAGRNDENAEHLADSKEQINPCAEQKSSSASDEDKDNFHSNGNDYPSDDDDEYEQPIYKKARQESPKLSSLLLGDGKKSNSKNDLNGSVSHYTIPNCTKVTHIKKKSKRSNLNPVSILPKGLNSCVSIMNIPNPNQQEGGNSYSLEGAINDSDIHSGTINLGGGVTISAQKSSLPATTSQGEPEASLRPMPSLKKMVIPKKGNFKKSSRYLNDMTKLSHSSMKPSDNQNSNEHHNGDSETENELELKVVSQRLEFEEKEHNLRMKVLEKQLQAYSNESQYWSLRLKLLQNGQEGPFGRIINGDFHVNS